MEIEKQENSISLEDKPFISNRMAIVIMSAILILGISMRFWSIGKFGFDNDELLHVLAAESILKHGEPSMPSGGLYKRSLGYTYIVSFFFKFLGISETTARIPSVIFNVIFLIASFLFIRRRIGNLSALIFLVVMTFSPFILNYARNCRMYAPFQLFYFLASICFFLGFEYDWGKNPAKRRRRQTWIEEKYGLNFVLLGLSLLLFLISYRLHSLTLTLCIAIICYTIILGLIEWVKYGSGKIVLSKYSFLFLSFIVIACFLYLLNPAFILNKIEITQNLLPWAKYHEYSWRYYYYFLSENYSFLFFLYPIGFLYWLSKDKKLAVFLFCSFTPLFFVYSILFEMKGVRYIYQIFPFFVVISVPVASQLIAHLWIFAQRNWETSSFTRKAIFLGTFLFAINAFCYPWLLNSRKIVSSAQHADWKQFYENTGAYFEKNAVIISTHHNSIYYYFKRKPDYFLQVEYNKKGDADYGTGFIPVTSLEKLKIITAMNELVYFVSSTWRMKNKVYVTSEILAFVKRNYDEIPLDYRSRIKLFKKKASKNTNPWKQIK